MINLTMKDQMIWVNEHETKKGDKFTTYAISVSKRSEDGMYTNKSVKVRFKKNHDVSCLKSGDLIDVDDAFLTLDTFRDRNGNEVKEVVIQVMDWRMVGGMDNFDKDTRTKEEVVNDVFSELEDEIPF